MEEWLDEEKERRRFYENAYLSRLGAFGDNDPSVATNLADMEPVRRINTLSSRRRQAQEVMKEERRKAEEKTAQIAKSYELTEGERIFQESLK